MVNLDHLYDAIQDTEDTARIFADALGELEWFRENFDQMLGMTEQQNSAHLVKMLEEYAR